ASGNTNASSLQNAPNNNNVCPHGQDGEGGVVSHTFCKKSGLDRAITALVCLFAFWAHLLAAEEIPAPTIRVTTRMVLVDVVVTDKQGKPVPGLRAEDFTIEEKGKTQKIASFTTSPEAGAKPEPLPPGIYSNRAQYRSPGGPITVLLLDALNTAFKDQAYARQQMLKFVQQQYRPGQRMAVFTLTGQLQVLQDFTSDPRILYAAMQRFRPEPQHFAGVVQTASGSPVASLDPAA